MTGFACSGAQWLNDKIDETVQSCGGWIGTATSTNALEGSQANLVSPEIQARACATHTQPTTIQAQWVGTHTFGAESCVGSAGNFPSTSTGTVGGLIVGGEFTKIPVNASDSIQFTIQLDLT